MYKVTYAWRVEATDAEHAAEAVVDVVPDEVHIERLMPPSWLDYATAT